METIPKSDCTKVGYIRKLHGVHGEVVLVVEPQFEYSVKEARRFFIELDGLLVPFFVAENGLRFKSAKTALVIFYDVNTESYARRLVGQNVFLIHDEITNEIAETNEPLFLNYLVTDDNLGEIGTIKKVEDFAGNIVMTVEHKGNEVLVPYSPDFVVSADEVQKTVVMRLPEGLFTD